MMNRHDSRHSNLVEIECSGQDGGKIVEKANTESNISDTKLNYNPVVKPWALKSGQNSIVLSMTYIHRILYTKACYTRDMYKNYSTCIVNWEISLRGLTIKVRGHLEIRISNHIREYMSG